MKITAVEQLHVDGGWDSWSFLKVSTDAGITGWSEFSEERARRGLSLVIDAMVPMVLGEDPREFGRIGAKLHMATQAPGGGLQTLAQGALANACLDITAKALGVPVYALYGGPLRRRIPLYWSHFGMYRARHAKLFEEVLGVPAVRDLDSLREAAKDVPRQGFKALKTNRLVFDAARLAGGPPAIGRGSGTFELNIEPWIVDDVVAQLEALREGAGPGVQLMMDLNFNYKTEGFRKLARAVERFDMMWLEIDTPDAAALATIRQSTTTPIASLEMMLGRRGVLPFLQQQAVDVGIIDVIYNGLPESYRMASLLDLYEVNAAAHNTFSLLGSAISATFAAVVPNFRVMEFDADEVPWRRELVTRPPRIENGEWLLGDAPGWGMDIVEEVARAHPARRH